MEKYNLWTFKETNKKLSKPYFTGKVHLIRRGFYNSSLGKQAGHTWKHFIVVNNHIHIFGMKQQKSEQKERRILFYLLSSRQMKKLMNLDNRGHTDLLLH